MHPAHVRHWTWQIRQCVGVPAFGGVALAASLLWSDAGQAVQLPVPCAAGTCTNTSNAAGFNTAPSSFVTYGQASAAQNGNKLTVTQGTNQAILNWQSFNIGAGGQVQFQQPSAASVALNKIFQANPSTILGQLTANGQVYLINPNGFVFGSGASVNVAGLMASSLGLYNGDAEFEQNSLYTQSAAAFAPALGTDPSAGAVTPGSIIVQSGASITAGSQGDILLAGGSVTNGGTLTAPGGQVILAAGQSIYLAASTDPSLRGLLVEVGGPGSVTNESGGVISVPQGNASLAAMAVNQSGVISATTAVSANGSVYLVAGNGAPSGASSVGACQNGGVLCATTGGTLTLGASSQIEISPDASGGTAVVGQPQTQSQIALQGQQVDIAGQITAPAATMNVVAQSNLNTPAPVPGDTAAQIRIAAGTDINLAGSVAQLPMSANLLSIQLLDNELEDDPQQRGGALHGQTVIADLLDGQPAIISDSSWASALEAVKESIYQRTATGGDASFRSGGDILFSSGASINVSGGAWNYAGGTLQSSYLVGADGRLYNLATANPALAYSGVLNPTYQQTYNGYGIQISQATPGLGYYQSAFSQGFSAGSVTFAAPTLALQGSLSASAVDGIEQRSAATIPVTSLAALVANVDQNPAAVGLANPFPSSGGVAVATGGTLQIGLPTAESGDPFAEFLAPAVTVVSSPTPIVAADGAPLLPQPLQLPAAYLTSDGFANTQILSDGAVTLPAGLPLNLGAGSALQIVAPQTLIGSSIQALGGDIDIQTAQTSEYQATAQSLGITLADGVQLNVSGQWTNDSIDAPASVETTTYQNGGSIRLSLTSDLPLIQSSFPASTSGDALVIGNDVGLLANGGAWLKSNNTLQGGSGGSILIDASPYQATLQIGGGINLQAFGVDAAAGGAFALNAPSLAVVASGDAFPSPGDAATGPAGTTLIGTPLFSASGFSAVALTATGAASAAGDAILSIDSGASIDAQAQSLELSSASLTRKGGGTVLAFAAPETLPQAQQSAVSLQFSVTPSITDPTATTIGDLDVQSGASILAAAGTTGGGNVSLSGQGSILIDGTIRAPGGTITAQIQTPTSVTDPGFLPDQVLQLGSGGVLDVSGTAITQLNTLKLPIGTVLGGGTVNLLAGRGQIITAPDSTIDIEGTSAVLDVLNQDHYQLGTVASPGGVLNVQGFESISLLGNLLAAGGSGGTGAVAGGTLQLDLNAITAPGMATPFPSAPYTIELVDSTSGMSPSDVNDNLAVLGVSQLQQSGVDTLSLQAGSVIALNNNMPLALGAQINLDSPSVSVGAGVQAALSAPYVSFTNSQDATSALAAQPGTGALSINAQQIVLSNFTTLQGVQSATLTSSGDVELAPLSLAYRAGGLTLDGDLTIDAARVFPASNASYTISTPGGVTFGGPQTAAPPVPLSANGSLTVQASDITVGSGGALMAPFGQISLQASDALSLQSGSLISVSADGAIIPYGQTAFGEEEWIYQAGTASIGVPTVPVRQVTLSAPNVSMASGATVDVSGGGDLTAYEWVPGTGGSVDALGASSAASQGYYAVLPSTIGQYAASDLQNFSGSNITAGQSVYLSGLPGLPAGFYPLLPASDALLPGAYLIQVQSAYQSQSPGSLGALPSGAPVIAGYFTQGTSGLHTVSSGYEGFAVYPGSYGQSLASYTLSNASSYFGASTAAANSPGALPADAGILAIDVGSALDVLGTVKTAGAPGGTAATVDISTTTAAPLTIIASQGSTGGLAGPAIDAATLSSWSAGDLVLGGQLSASGASLDVTASTVTIDSGVQLSAGQLLLVADQGIDVQAGAVLASGSGLTGMAPAAPINASALTLNDAAGQADAGAALLALSDSTLPLAQRSGVPASGATIQMAGTLQTRGALVLDAPAGVAVTGSIDAPGAAWSLGSNSIAFTADSTSSADTLQIGSNLLSQMQEAGSLRLASAGAIDLLTPLTLGMGASGAPQLGALTLSAAAINNESGGAVLLGAQNLVLEGTGPGSGAAALPVTTAGGNSLALSAENLQMAGTGSLAINGDAQTTLTATTALTGQGGTLAIAGSATMTAPELTAASNTLTTIAVQNGLQIGQSGTAAAASSLVDSLGGSLALSAASIDDSGSIIVPAGTISLQASGDLNLESGALVSTAGIGVTVLGTTQYAPGGRIVLDSGGNLTLPPGAVLDVSGAGSSGTGDAPAGSLTLIGEGNVSLGATLQGGAAADAAGGSFTLAGGRLSGGLGSLPATAANGTTALLPGFTNALSIDVGSGDLDLTAGTSLTANQIILSADSGNIDIAGTLSALSAGQRGSIGLYAGSNLTLESSAQLLANGGGASGRGGEIALSAGLPGSPAGSATITLDSGAIISASGEAQSGTLILRAPALSTAAGVAINGDVADAESAGQIDVGQVLVEPELAPVTGDFTANTALLTTPVNAYLAQLQANGGLPAGLQGGNILVQPAVVVQAPGDLTLSQSIDLAAIGLSAPIDLTVQAQGSLTLDGSMAGFNLQSDVGQPASTALHLVAGANVNSANPLATANPLTSMQALDANLEIGANALVQTGTGDLDLAAAHNVIFDSGASAYTTGNPGNSSAVTIRLGTSVPVYFPTSGGNLSVTAGADVIGQGALGSVSSWQARTSIGSLGEWGINLGAFDQNPWTVATFGGGDLRINAGADVLNVTAAAADSMLVTGTTQTLFTGGGLSVNAGGSLINGQYFLADGAGVLNVGGAVQSSSSATGSSGSVGTLFALQNSQLALWAQGDIDINAVVDPTLLAQPNATGSLSKLYFANYGPTSSFSVLSSGGSITLDNSDTAIDPVVGADYETQTTDGGFLIAPSSLGLSALTGDVQLGGSIATLYPSSAGRLSLFAGRDIVGGTLVVSDAPAGALPTSINTTPALINLLDLTELTDSLYNFDADLHAGQNVPTSIAAGRDIDELSLYVPEASTVEAGRNIVDLNYFGQNLNPTDVTLIYAGGSFTDAPTFDPATGDVTGDGSNVAVQVGGPGYLDVLAGSTIDLAFSNGVTTVGNQINGNLPVAAGANITMAAGLGQTPDYTNFYQQIIVPSAAFQAQLVSYVESLTGQTGLSTAQADSEFLQLDGHLQASFVDRIFFNQLDTSGVQANTVRGAGYALGYNAIQTLFSATSTSAGSSGSPYSGDLDLTYSQIYSLAGGDISLLVPGGALNVGLAQPPGGFLSTTKAPSDLGIVAQGAGNVDIYALGSVNVNTSRVFTLGGGNILIWSQTGSIDAGNGAKTSLSIPPPKVTFNATTGLETLSYDSAVAGSGIRTIQTSPTEAAGNVDLIAPEGSVNAGDAGIGAAGNINIAAVTVTGVSNISFGGSATGVPAVVSNLTASLSGAASSASAATNSENAALQSQSSAANAAEAAPLAQAAISWLDVFVTGLGEENCKPDDLQCLQREQSQSH